MGHTALLTGSDVADIHNGHTLAQKGCGRTIAYTSKELLEP